MFSQSCYACVCPGYSLDYTRGCWVMVALDDLGGLFSPVASAITKLCTLGSAGCALWALQAPRLEREQSHRPCQRLVPVPHPVPRAQPRARPAHAAQGRRRPGGRWCLQAGRDRARPGGAGRSMVPSGRALVQAPRVRGSRGARGGQRSRREGSPGVRALPLALATAAAAAPAGSGFPHPPPVPPRSTGSVRRTRRPLLCAPIKSS